MGALSCPGCSVDVFVMESGRDSVDEKLQLLLKLVLKVIALTVATKESVMAAIDDLNAIVAQVQGDVAKAVTLVQSLNQQIADLTAKVAAGVDPAIVAADVASLQATATQLEGVLPAPAPAPAPGA